MGRLQDGDRRRGTLAERTLSERPVRPTFAPVPVKPYHCNPRRHADMPESRLASQSFVRIHRSTVIDLTRIKGMRHVGAGAWVVIDADDTERPVGRNYLSGIRHRLRQGASIESYPVLPRLVLIHLAGCGFADEPAKAMRRHARPATAEGPMLKHSLKPLDRGGTPIPPSSSSSMAVRPGDRCQPVERGSRALSC